MAFKSGDKTSSRKSKPAPKTKPKAKPSPKKDNVIGSKAANALIEAVSDGLRMFQGKIKEASDGPVRGASGPIGSVVGRSVVPTSQRDNVLGGNFGIQTVGMVSGLEGRGLAANPVYNPVVGQRGFFVDPTSPTGFSFSSGSGGITHAGSAPSAQHRVIGPEGVSSRGFRSEDQIPSALVRDPRIRIGSDLTPPPPRPLVDMGDVDVLRGIMGS